jgi:hypothetical protein
MLNPLIKLLLTTDPSDHYNRSVLRVVVGFLDVNDTCTLMVVHRYTNTLVRSGMYQYKNALSYLIEWAMEHPNLLVNLPLDYADNKWTNELVPLCMMMVRQQQKAERIQSTTCSVIPSTSGLSFSVTPPSSYNCICCRRVMSSSVFAKWERKMGMFASPFMSCEKCIERDVWTADEAKAWGIPQMLLDMTMHCMTSDGPLYHSFFIVAILISIPSQVLYEAYKGGIVLEYSVWSKLFRSSAHRHLKMFDFYVGATRVSGIPTYCPRCPYFIVHRNLL